jgi:predicted membrane protein
MMSWRVFFGTALVVIGAGFLLDQLDILEFGPILATWWPMILILIGVIQLATRSVPVPAGMLVIVLGAFFQIDRLEFVDLNLGQLFWPGLLIVVGGYLLLTRSGRRSPMVDGNDELNSFVIFGGVDRRLESQGFQGGSAVALFGGSEIDLRDTKLHTDGAELDLAVAFGGMEVMVPEDWRVRMSGLPIFGGWSNKTRRRDEAASDGPLLNIRCVAAFGGIEVHN